ncbi:MAG: flagellar hook capping FlgD N-terminal domain-containing protein [Desulfatitalea sp.]
MAIYGLDQVASKGAQTAAAAKKDIMGKDDFLRLLVSQLQSQDPLNPMDSTAFTAQLAQFSSLEQLQNINTTLGTIGTSQSVLTNGQAVSFIGKTITAIGDTIDVQNGQSQSLQFSLDTAAEGSYLRVYDRQGNFIRQIETGALPAGQNSVSWDGRDYLGGQAPSGTYTFDVEAVNELGNSVPVTQFVSGTVTGVHFLNGVAYLQCGSREIAMGNVVNVLTTEE